jgi:hypothetical protein
VSQGLIVLNLQILSLDTRRTGASECDSGSMTTSGDVPCPFRNDPHAFNGIDVVAHYWDSWTRSSV